MRTTRQAIALDPRQFGRRPPTAAVEAPQTIGALNQDLRLFGATFAAGFLFVSVLLA